MTGPRIEIGVLGTSTPTVDDVAVPLTARRVRSLLAALALGPGSGVPADRLVDALGARRPPNGATNTLQGNVSRLRRLMEPDLGTGETSHFVRRAAGGYPLSLGPDDRIDSRVLDTSISEAQGFVRSLPNPALPQITEQPDLVELKREHLDRVLATWRGDPYSDLGDDDIAVAERRRLAERRVDGQTAGFVMDLMIGRLLRLLSAPRKSSTPTHFESSGGKCGSLHSSVVTGRRMPSMCSPVCACIFLLSWGSIRRQR